MASAGDGEQEAGGRVADVTLFVGESVHGCGHFY